MKNSWLPPVLDPTPMELYALRERCLRLANAIERYCDVLAGERFVDVIGDGIQSVWTERVFADLLDSLDELGSWSCGDGSIEVSGALPALVAGWPEAGQEALENWLPDIDDAYRSVVHEVGRLGLRFAAGSTHLEMTVSGSDDVAFSWRSPSANEKEILEDRLEPLPLDRVEVSTNAKFKRLHGVRGFACSCVRKLRGDPGKDSETLTSPQGVLMTAADFIDDCLKTIEEQHVVDSHGGRLLRFNLLRCPDYGGHSKPSIQLPPYPQQCLDSDPFEAALELEAATGLRLKSGADPAWILEAFEAFKRAEKRVGRELSFADYVRQRYGLIDQSQPRTDGEATATAPTTHLNDADCEVASRLTARSREFVIAMGEAQLWAGNRLTQPQIQSQAGYPGENARRTFDQLRKEGLIESLRIAGGGTQLTASGVGVFRRLKESDLSTP